MKKAFIITYEYPLIFYDFTLSKVGPFVDLFDFLSITTYESFGVEMIGSVGFCEVFISEIIFLEGPGNRFLLMERVDCLVNYSDGKELGGKGVVFPLCVSEYFELEGFEECRDASDV